MASTANNRNLFATLPNEIGYLILYKLDFYDLISCFFVAGLWAQSIDQDDILRKKMFRLPKTHSKETTKSSLNTSRRFVESLWKDLYASVDPSDKDDDPWDHVEINPLFDTDHYGTYIPEPYEFGSNRTFDVSELVVIPKRHHRLLRALCGSMLVTYPPVQHVKYKHSHSEQHDAAEFWTHRSKGVTIRDLLKKFQATTKELMTVFPWDLTNKPRFKYRYVCLWHDALHERKYGCGRHHKVLDLEDLIESDSLSNHRIRKHKVP